MPTVILAKTVKGDGMGAAGESLNPTHGNKKMDDEDVKAIRDRFQIPVPDEQLKDGQIPFFHPGEKSPEVEYILERRKAMGGFLPQRRKTRTQALQVQPLDPYERQHHDTGESALSTNMAFVIMINISVQGKKAKNGKTY